jgi:predicted transcriptional regulator
MDQLDSVGHALSDASFLARSGNRVRVLTCLSERAMERETVAAETGISRATLGRVLAELEERHWVGSSGRTYEATALGAFVARQFLDLLARLDAARNVCAVVDWFPEAGFPFDLDAFGSAEVVLADGTNALAPATHLQREVRDADHVRVLTSVHLSTSLETGADRALAGDQTVDAVVTPAVVEALQADPDLATASREVLATGHSHVYLCTEDLPYVFVVADDRVNLVLFDRDGAARAVVASEASAVREWADETFERYRAGATRLDETTFTA